MGCCSDTFNGVIHRFPADDQPCYCGAVVKNRRQPERLLIHPPKPDGSKTAPVLRLLEHAPLTVDQIAQELHESRQWVKHALTILGRAEKIMRTGRTTKIDDHGYRRFVAIYGIRPDSAYPESDGTGTADGRRVPRENGSAGSGTIDRRAS